jgi:predicted MFS family arabinose efflux permease
LPCLLLVTFTVGTDDFVVAGILPEIARDLRVGEPAAGQLVSIFSVTYAVAAPVLAVATARLDRRLLLVSGLAIFALVNAGAALAPSYPALVVIRVLAAVVAAAMTPPAFATAVALARPERAGRAIGTVAAGLTVALVVGVPLGTWLGATFGWRSTFWFVAGLAVIAGAAVPVFLPALPGDERVRLGQRIQLLGRPAVLLGVVGTAIGATASLMTYTYIAPIARDLGSIDSDALALLIAAVGVAGAVGTVLGGRATDRWGSGRALLATFAVQLLATAGLAVVGLAGGGSGLLPLVVLGFALWGLAGWAFNPPMNARLLTLAGSAGAEAVALNTSALYVGIAAGGAVGGVVLDAAGAPAVLLTSLGIGLATFVLLAASVRRHPTPAPGAGEPITDRVRENRAG